MLKLVSVIIATEITSLQSTVLMVQASRLGVIV